MVNEPVYKWLNGREATHSPDFRYRLNVWTPRIDGVLVACNRGYHLCRVQDLSTWCNARDLFRAEYEGDPLDGGDKLVVRRARIVEHLKGWNERTARLCAADFAERVLPVFEAKRAGDDRPRLAIQAARDYANGLIGAAARAAAWAAAWDAAGDAAWDAAGDAAGYAAGYAAGAAAGYAAGYAAWAAARDAAGAAARDAAGDAAGDAAWDAAGDAAWDAAGAAERLWQGQRILDYAEGRLG